MTAGGTGATTALMVCLTCGLVTVFGVGASSAAAAPERDMDTIAGTARWRAFGGVLRRGRAVDPAADGTAPVGVR